MIDKQIIKAMNEISVPDRIEQRKAILALEKELLKHDQEEIEPTHLVHGGMYARAVTVKKGTILTGNIYKFDHIEIMAHGKIAVTTDDGRAHILSGFNLMPALSGKKRAAYVLEDTTWLTVHAVGSTIGMTPDDIQEKITSETFEDLDDFYHQIDRVSFTDFCLHAGLTEQQVREIAENTDDLIDIDLDSAGVRIDDSQIEGKGIFSNERFYKGEKIAQARIGKNRTQLGRYINHSVRPNVIFVADKNKDNEDVVNVIATRSISKNEELTVDYARAIEVAKELNK